MIYIVTLNPAIDLFIYPNSLNLDDINVCEKHTFLAGGKGINIAKILTQFEIPHKQLFILGGKTQKLFLSLLDKDSKYEYISIKEDTRINIKIRTNVETDINQKGPSISNDELDSFKKLLNQIKANDILVIGGSSLYNNKQNILKDIFEYLKNKNIKYYIDLSKESLNIASNYTPYMIKINEDELLEVFPNNGIDLLLNKGISNICITKGKEGYLFKNNKLIIENPSIKGKLIDSLGAGDSFLAGLLIGDHFNYDLNKSLNLASSAASATAFKKGIATKKEIMELYYENFN